MRRLIFLLAFAISVMTLLSGCTASRLDADFGTSYKLAKINQVLDPDAGKNFEPVYGLNGIAAKSVMDNYYAGFAEKKTAPTFTLNVGGIGAGQ
ncbi:MAG: pilus assembly protein [Deltaproteobacteria bacterium HGW-Deltaproteobacteria-7]|jgi:hypothetical protein|nr:MAG: pilus assembly protein [Deltaproteobacteria bacterium HGW-Deltaproteobacteria-7]PKN52150.1 MAG: pilus assembly protein [Deltaproteobacteria bacterium HGW-Deltaproteobacteria-13]